MCRVLVSDHYTDVTTSREVHADLAVCPGRYVQVQQDSQSEARAQRQHWQCERDGHDIAVGYVE